MSRLASFMFGVFLGLLAVALVAEIAAVAAVLSR